MRDNMSIRPTSCIRALRAHKRPRQCNITGSTCWCSNLFLGELNTLERLVKPFYFTFLRLDGWQWVWLLRCEYHETTDLYFLTKSPSSESVVVNAEDMWEQFEAPAAVPVIFKQADECEIQWRFREELLNLQLLPSDIIFTLRRVYG
jgi:hypothetical protein